jgi:hypothetical protein
LFEWYLLTFCYAFVETLQETGAHKRWAGIFPYVAFVQVHQTTTEVPDLASTCGLLPFLTMLLRCSADDVYAPFLASLVIVLNIIKVTLIGLGVVKDDGVVNSMTRNGDHR